MGDYLDRSVDGNDHLAIVLSVAIIHAPWKTERADNVRKLKTVFPEAIVVCDDDRSGVGAVGAARGCWPIARRAWLSAPKWSTHHLVLEDDAHPCDDFSRLAVGALGMDPTSSFWFFYGHRGCSVANALPKSVMERWLPWAEKKSAELPHHDLLFTMGMRALDVPIRYTEPSLVEHGPMESLIGHLPCRAFDFSQRPSSFVLRTR